MKFPATTFTVGTAIKKGETQHQTVVTLSDGDVDDQSVIDSLISGQSPRVRWQNSWRVNGAPKVVTMSPTEWIGNPPKATVVNIPMSREQIREKAMADVDFLAEMKRQILAEMKQNDQNPTNKPNK